MVSALLYTKCDTIASAFFLWFSFWQYYVQRLLCILATIMLLCTVCDMVFVRNNTNHVDCICILYKVVLKDITCIFTQFPSGEKITTKSAVHLKLMFGVAGIG